MSAMRHWLEYWDYLDRTFWGIFQWFSRDLTSEQVRWQPIRQVASIGWNLQHLGEMLDHYLHHVFHATTRPYREVPLVTMQRHALDDGRFGDLSAIGQYHRQVSPAYRQFLEKLQESDLDRALAPGNPRTWAWAIGHIAEHESYHLGKCTLLRSLIKHGSVSPG